MTNRERFTAALSFEKTDRPCHIEHNYWPETFERWKTEGLPGDVIFPSFDYLSEGTDLFDYNNVIRFAYLFPQQYFIPAFKTEILEESGAYRLERNDRGILQKVSKLASTIPMFIDYPVKCRRDYEGLKERLGIRFSNRCPENWGTLKEKIRTQQKDAVCTHMDGFFAYPREIMGVDNFLFLLYDDPELIKDMLRDRVEFYMELFEGVIKDTKPDFAFIWEDMCYKNGPLLSPGMFREFMLPNYKRLTSFLRDMGVKNIIVDSDGDVRKLIPLWIEGGVTGLLPFEVRAGMDVVAIAKEFPTLQIIGGIDKHEIAKGREAIDAELERVLPYMIQRGGYIVALDHGVPPTISLDDFMYYAERVREYKAR
ncbi:MAG: uroporphyrinogen decarboxylase family protein [Clostridia bacterium]|nr:uroporphyrinogen decarboxylase family protein [Clostridia bacterium]